MVDYAKPVMDRSFTKDDYAEVSPNANTVRYPAAGTTFTHPWDYIIVENRSATWIRVRWDADADVTHGQRLLPGQLGRFPLVCNDYLSVHNGDGTAIPLRFFRW